jgi:hypothetical protein
MQKEEWKTIFMVACWYLRTWGNKAIFDENFQHPTNPIQVILKMAKDIDECEHYHFIRGL